MSSFEYIFAFNSQSPLLFTQTYFWVFFAVVYAIYAFVLEVRGKDKVSTSNHVRLHLRNIYLMLVSWFFYYKTSGIFLLILLFITLSDWSFAWLIHRAHRQGKRSMKNLWLTLSVLIDLGILCYFKYAYFGLDVFNTLFGTQLTITEKILLPVGISFYIFQVISYTTDVYRGKIAPVKSPLDFGFFVSFFPQLVAGPIVRAEECIPQLYKPFFLGRRQFGIAVFWILNGLAKKIILSDYLAVNFIDRVFDNPLLFSGFENMFAVFTYSLQVYADFSGYTDIAIGLALLMGFYLPKNFDSPYKSRTPQEFWRRWHMSLSRWLKGYVYIPLGGNRNATFGTYFCILFIAFVIIMLSKSVVVASVIAALAVILTIVSLASKRARLKISTNINMLNTMLLGGLWHGASWNFMIWGGLNGVGILGFKIWRHFKQWLRSLVSGLIFAAFFACNYFWPSPVLMIFTIWSGVFFFGALVRCLYSAIWPNRDIPWLNNSWNIFMTFVFISFTRLFFRSGSNLDPAIANETAWNTAKAMVNSIGGHWNTAAIPEILSNYWPVFTLFVVGMIIHWLPNHFKRWYRVNFALMPIWLMGIVVVATIFVLYQFVTADLQPFIYFQF